MFDLRDEVFCVATGLKCQSPALRGFEAGELENGLLVLVNPLREEAAVLGHVVGDGHTLAVGNHLGEI